MKLLFSHILTGITALCAVLFLPLSGCKQDKQSEESGFVFKESETGSSLLWEVSGNGLSSPSYLFGTIHLIPEKDFFTGKAIEAALAKSNKLVMEVGNIDDMGAALSVTGSMTLEEGSIIDHIDSSKFALLIAGVQEHLSMDSGTFMMAYGKMKPMGLYTLGMQLDALKMKGMKSYEKYFMELAFHHNIPSDGLETIDFQASLFNKISYNDVVDNLLQGFEKGFEDGGYTELVAAYRKNDLDVVMEMMTETGDVMMEKYREDFLDGRNKRWIPIIEQMTKKEVCFIAVGAAHLPGEFGVINLLRKAGYTVKPLQID